MYKKKDWDTTRDSYLRWLNNTGLKKEFWKKIRYKNLALWWITKLVDKDIVLDNNAAIRLIQGDFIGDEEAGNCFENSMGLRTLANTTKFNIWY